MSATNASGQKTIPPIHEDFYWIFGHGRQERLADFLELARDAVIEQVSAPTIGKADASGLFRLSIVVTTMLRNAADEQIALLNTPS